MHEQGRAYRAMVLQRLGLTGGNMQTIINTFVSALCMLCFAFFLMCLIQSIKDDESETIFGLILGFFTGIGICCFVLMWEKGMIAL